MANIRLENVTKVYKGGVRAVSDANLEIRDKEFIVLVGPSGCGKSTTLRMIAGLEDITSGNVFIGGKYVNNLEPKDRNIAMVFQNYALYPHMTVYENLAYSLKCHHAKKEEIDAKVMRTADILGIGELLERTPRELSGGQRQRVALGRAIVREPDAFLFDEPLSNLDAKLRVQMRSEISRLHKEVQTTFVYVTHDQTEAMTMGERIVVMKDGFIQQVDEPMNLYEHPANIFVATFLGSPQMNIFEGRLEARGEERHFVNDGGIDVAIPPIEVSQIEESRYPFEAYLGVRPQDIVIGDKGYETTVELVERLGEQTLVYFHLPGRKEYVIASTGPRSRILEKDVIKVSFNPEKLHLFDKATEKNLSSAEPIVRLPIDGDYVSEDGRLALEERRVLMEKAKGYAFPYGEAAQEKPEGECLTYKGQVMGLKDYGGEKVYFFKEHSTGRVYPLKSEKPLKEKAKLTLYVPIASVNLEGEPGRLTADEPIGIGNVAKAELAFRPRGCFLKEETPRNHEKAYRLTKLTRLGELALLELTGIEGEEVLHYLVKDTDLLYINLVIYMRKKAKD